MHLSSPKDSFSGFGARSEQTTTPHAALFMKSHVPTLELNAARGVYHSMLIQAEPPDALERNKPKRYQGQIVSRTKPFQGGEDDIRMRADKLPDGLTDGPVDRLSVGLAEGLSEELPEEPADELVDRPFLLDEPPDHFEDFMLPDGLTDGPAYRLSVGPAEGLSEELPEEPADELADRPFLLDEPPDHFEDFLLFIFTLMKTTSCLGVTKMAHNLLLCVKPTKEQVSFSGEATSFSAPIEILLLNLDPPSIPGDHRRSLSPKDLHISSATIIEDLPLKPNG
ncbi:unnamed protein product [Arabidopsis halleri]